MTADHGSVLHPAAIAPLPGTRAIPSPEFVSGIARLRGLRCCWLPANDGVK